MPKVEILTIGNELLDGKIVNSNAAFLANELHHLGFWVQQITTVSDQESEIIRALQEAWARVEIILVTGGLGPSHADLTTASIAQFLKGGLEFFPTAYQNMLARFSARGMDMPENNIKQAYLPQGTCILNNSHGTAPGFSILREGHYLAAMPGVPHEMKPMFLEQVVPQLQAQYQAQPLIVKRWRTSGLPESVIIEQLEKLEWVPKDVIVMFQASPFGVDIQAKFPPNFDTTRQQEIIQRMDDKIKYAVYTTGQDDLETVVAGLLIQQNKTIAVAESCTGGMLMNRLTNIPGSSQFFLEGRVTYSNQSKIRLGVSEDLLERFGAVSEECAACMANAIRQYAESDIGIATTGIAGPTGETPLKPLGLVYIGYSDKNKTQVQKAIFQDDRLVHKQRTSQSALLLLWNQLKPIVL